MKKKYMENIQNNDDFNIAGIYFLEHNLLKNKNVDEDNLLTYISSIIEAVTIKNCIKDDNEEYLGYLKFKTREMRWLAAKTRFRAKSILSP